MISVIMSVYNGEKYLDECIESILIQTYKNFEFIIVNDGSNDNTQNILEKYSLKDKRIRIIKSEKNGVVQAINKGLKIAVGTYITRMDADDLAISTRLEKQREFFEENNFDMCGSLYEYIGEYKVKDYQKIINEFELINEYTSEKLILGAGHSICQPTFFMKKELLEDVGYYSLEDEIIEDLKLQITLLENNKKIGMQNEVLCKIRKHKLSRSTLKNQEVAITTMQVRVNYIMNKLVENNSKILIWACGSGGINLYNYLVENYNNIQIEGFIDSNKYGQVILGKKVFNPEEIESLEFDYIFIATSPGRVEVQQFLTLKKYKPLKNYFCIYT